MTEWAWVCENCGAPVDIRFHEVGYMEAGELTIHCTGDAEGCSPLDNRELRTPEQLKRTPVLLAPAEESEND